MNNNKTTIEIGFGTIVWVMFAIIALTFLGNIIDIFILLFISILIALALCPLVDSLEKRKINRSLSAILILLGIFAVIVLSAVSIVIPLFQQTETFLESLPSLIKRIYPYPIDINQIDGLSLVPGQVYKIAMGTFSGVLSFFTVIVISFYIVKEMHNLQSYLEFWFGKEKAQRYHEIVKKLEEQTGYWVRGELTLMLIVGVLSYIGYLIIGLPFTIALGVIAGVLELVPNIGPTIATIPAAIVGFSISTSHGIAAIIVSIIVQQLENNIIVPKIMQKSIGLNPLITILGLMIGYRIGGPIVAIISLPLILSARVIISHIKLNKNNLPEID